VLGATDEEVRRGIGLIAELHHEGAFRRKRRSGRIRDVALPLHGALVTPEGALLRKSGGRVDAPADGWEG
jgi:hypothetical protein